MDSHKNDDTPRISDMVARENDATLLITPDTLYLSTIGPEHYEVLAHHSIHNLLDFQNVYFAQKEFSQPFKSLSIYYDRGGSYDLIPLPLLRDTTSGKDWLPGVEEDCLVLHNAVSDEHFGVLFTINRDWRDFIERSFSRRAYFHPVTILVEYALLLSRKLPQHFLVAHLTGSPQGGLLDVVHTYGGAVCYSGRFHLNGSTDLLYFLTAVWRNEGLSYEDGTLRLFTDYSDNETQKAINHLKRGIKDFKINHYSDTLNTKQALRGMPSWLKLKTLCV